MPPAEPLIEWPQPFLELLGFVAFFLAAGAAGFRWFVIGRSEAGRAVEAGERAFAAAAERRAALLGFLGAAVMLAMFANRVPEVAARRQLSVAEFLSTPAGAAPLALLLLVALGLALAIARLRVGWWLASAALVLNVLRPALFGGWTRSVNPAHELAGGLWIGTLFLLVACGLAPLLRAPLDPARRGALAASMVHAFSPLALASAALLAAMGVITAWLHLKRLSALWTTPYGVALIVKLCLVGGVLALGAWNWRRQKPRMGTEAAAHELKRSAATELAVAGLVLAASAILVSLPSPR